MTPTAPKTRGCTPEKVAHQRRSARVSGRSAKFGASCLMSKPLSQGSKPLSSSVEEASEPSYPFPGRVASPAPYSAHIVVIAMTSPPKSEAREGSCKSICVEDGSCVQSMAHIATFESKDDVPETPSSPAVTELAPFDPPLLSLPPATSTVPPTLPTLEPSPPSSNTNVDLPSSTFDSSESKSGAYILPIDLPKLIVIRPTPPSSCPPSPSPPPDDLPRQIYDAMGIKVLVTPPSRESSPLPQQQPPITDIDPTPTSSSFPPIEGPRVIEIPEYIPSPAPVPASIPIPMIGADSSETQPVLESMDYMQYDHQRGMMGIPGPGPTTMLWRQQQQGFTLQQQDQQGQGEGGIQLQQPYTYSYDYEYANGLSFSSDGQSSVLPSSPEQQRYVIPLEPVPSQGDGPMEDLDAETGYESGEDDGTTRKRRWLGGKRRVLGMWEIACQFRVSELSVVSLSFFF